MSNILNALKQPSNIFYIILVGLGFVLGGNEYGFSIMVYNCILLVCLIVFISNTIEAYIYLKAYLKKELYLNKGRAIYLFISSGITIACFFLFLSAKAQIAILIFCSILLGALFLYDLVKTAIKSLF